MLCTRAPVLPHRHDWFYEVKRNGRRALAVKDRAKVTFYSHDGGTFDCPAAVEAVRKLNAGCAVIDCEIIALAHEEQKDVGASNSKLAECTIHLYAFDLLHLNGRDLTQQTIEYRKHRLCTLTMNSGVLFSPSLECEPDMLVAEVARLGLPGIIAKRRGSVYQSGKNDGSWVTRRVKSGEPFRRAASRTAPALARTRGSPVFPHSFGARLLP